MSTVQADLEPADPSLIFSGVGSSIDITSEARDLSLSMADNDGDDEDLYSESLAPNDPTLILLHLVDTVQSTLKTSQGNLSEVKDMVSSIAGIDMDLEQKCATKAVIDLLRENVSFANEGNFKVILTGVDILVKYAVNLLKPKKNPNWRSIKTSNTVFLTKVKPLQGHESVLGALGYTGTTQSSFEFPSSCQDPDMNAVAVVTTDLLVLQKELSQFCSQIHVNQDRFLMHFSTLPRGDLPPTPTPASPQGSTEIPLQRVEPLAPEEEPRESAKDTTPKRPVPAPRLSLQPAGPKEDPAVEAPTQPVTRDPQPDLTTGEDIPSAETLPDVKSPTQDLIAFSGDIVPSVGPIKYPPSFHPPQESSPQGKPPPPVAAPRSARGSPSAEPSQLLRRPADFVAPPGSAQGVATPLQSDPRLHLPQAQYAPSALPLTLATQGLQQLGNPPCYSAPVMNVTSQAGQSGAQSNHAPAMLQALAPHGFQQSGITAYSRAPGMTAASQTGSGHVPQHAQYAPTSTMQPLFTPQDLQHSVNTTAYSSTHGMTPATQAVLLQGAPGQSTPAMPMTSTTRAPQQPGNRPTPARGPPIAASFHQPATPPQGVQGIQAQPTQPVPSTGIPSRKPPPRPPKPGASLESSVDPPGLPQIPGKQGSPGGVKPFRPPAGAQPTPLAGVPPENITRGNLRPTTEIRDRPKPGVTIEKCAMCEGKDGIVHCDKCQSARCEACDKRWHSHPKRKTHKTRLLVDREVVEVKPKPTAVREPPAKQEPAVVREPPVQVEPVIATEGCFACDKDATEVAYKCLTCDNEFFCRECYGKFHSKRGREGHERVAVGGRTPAAPSGHSQEKATPPKGGARPKRPDPQGANQGPLPPQELPANRRQAPPRPALSRQEQLQAKIDRLLAEDVGVLEKLDEVKSKYDEARSVDIEAQLMKEEKLLRIRHQRISDEMDDLKVQLDDLAAGIGRQLQGRGDQHMPVPVAALPHREGYQQHPASNQDRHSQPPRQGGPPQLPPRSKVRKWVCEHCTFLNEDVSRNICAVCDKTTAEPQIIVAEQEQQPITMQEEIPLRATVQPPRQVQEEGRLYEYETQEARAERLRKKEQEFTAKQMEKESQKQQQNMSYRLLIMYEEARHHGHSLEDVKTAWDIVDREGTTMSPLDWLNKHLTHQLTMIKKDVIKEFCRQFQLEVPAQSDHYIGTEEVHEQWRRNDGDREKTADACLKRIVEKVDTFLQTTDGVSERMRAARILLDSSFDGELAKWEMQVQAAAGTAQEVHDWLDKMWEASDTMVHSIEEIFKGQTPEGEKKEKVRRILMAERGMLWAAVDCVFTIKAAGNDWPDSIEAVEACNGDLHRAKEYFKECALCFEPLIRSKLIGLPYCQCHLCTECFTGHFRFLAQTTPCMLKYTCPGCDQPNLENLDAADFQNYFGLLSTMIREYLSSADYDLYQSKLVNWGLMSEANFRWCVGCSNGFVLDGLPIKRVQCPHCNKYQCFDCKQAWQDQHQGVTCEQFEAWKRDNDPELQAQGLAAHLKLNGINCPKCKMRYELAKGGCMHFKCPTCQHEFCCGCNLPFMKYPACKKYRTCQGKGLHAHHPRDCLYHLRDEDVATLQQLLQNNNVDYSRQDANAPNAGTCPVNVQLETHEGMQDNLCGRPLEGQSGLCNLHYKEYLVTLINQNNLDPADILTANDLEAALRRNDKQVPGKQGNEADEAYRKRLVGMVKQELPLLRAGGGAAAGPPPGQAAGGPRRGRLLGAVEADVAGQMFVEDLEQG